MVTERAGLRLGRRRQAGLRLAGGGLLAATGAVHLDLYMTGYRSIPVIGWLFLLQVIAAFVLAAAVLVSGSRLAAGAGAGFSLATLGGYLLSVRIGLFGFTEVRTTAGLAAGVIEIAAFAALAALAAVPAAGRPAAGPPAGRAARAGRGPRARREAPARGEALPARLQAGVPGAGRVIAGVSAAALVLLGVFAAAAAGGGTPAAGGALKAVPVAGVTVLANARGFTLYWFAPDTATTSRCTGSCAAYWPPVKGPVTAGPGVNGRLGTIRRPGGSVQATYDGHPLYTYIGDTAPGQARGNKLNLNGGLWHEVTASG